MTPTRPPCFQCPIFSSYERSSTPRRSSAMAVSDFLISLTKLGHGPLSSSSNSGVSLFFLSSLMAAPFGAWISNRNPDNAIKLIQGLSGGTPECGSPKSWRHKTRRPAIACSPAAQRGHWLCNPCARGRCAIAGASKLFLVAIYEGEPDTRPRFVAPLLLGRNKSLTAGQHRRPRVALGEGRLDRRGRVAAVVGEPPVTEA